MPCWMLTNTAVTSAVMNFRCHKLIAKVNNQKNSDMKNFICNQYGERHPIFTTSNIKFCGQMTKLEAIRMECACIFFISAEYLQKFEFLNFPRYCSNMPKVSWAMSYNFVAHFIRFPAVQKFGKWLQFEKVTESLKVETFFWDTV